MAEVSVNIRGRDDGLGSHLDNLRQKVEDLGRSTSELNNLDDLTPTQQKNTIGRVGQDTTSGQQARIREEYSNIRQSNADEFSEMEGKFKSGEIDKNQFDKFREEFQANQKELGSLEDSELLAVEKEMNQTLREIHRELTDERKIERELRQRDNSEHGGMAGGILRENRDLRNLQNNSDDEEEISALQAQINDNNKRLRSLRHGDEEEGTDMSGIDFRQVGMMGSSVARGDLMGTVQGGLAGAGKATGMMGSFAIAAIIATLVKEALGAGDKLREGLAPVSAMRGNGLTGSLTNDAYRSNFNDRIDIGALGMDNQEFSEAMRNKAVSSGRAGGDLQLRTYADEAFKKGFGGDAGQFSQFERFAEGQESSTQIALDVLNVLTSIEKSSLKEDDLSTLSEKLSAQNTILSLQRSKRDSVDNTDALKMLAAFESAGLSGKGERASGFISQTLQGLGEGGSDNAQMWKIEAARRANPEMANDPAALRRAVRFNPDDPEYMAEFFKMIKERTGGNQMVMDDALYTFFNPESEKDMEIYEQLMAGGDPDELLKGRDMDKMKARKSTLNAGTMVSDAESGVGVVTEAIKDFTNQSQGWMDVFSTLVKDLVTGNSVNVSILDDKTKPRPSNVAPSNKVKTGQ